MLTNKIGLGGGCHWCTEALFQLLKGVIKVDQGWISAEYPNDQLSEGVIVHYNPKQISQKQLIEIHLKTHSATADHQLRTKYRSAVYAYNKNQHHEVFKIIEVNQVHFSKKIITQALILKSFKLNNDQYLNYYKNNPAKPFCKRHIIPKLHFLKQNNYPITSDVEYEFY